MALSKQTLFPIVLIVCIFTLAYSNINFIALNQDTAFIDGQYYNFLIRRFSLAELIIFSPNPQTAGFLVVMYPSRIIPSFVFPFFSVGLVVLSVFRSNRNIKDSLWASLPIVPYCMVPTKEFLIFLVVLIMPNRIWKGLLLLLARPAMFLITLRLKRWQGFGMFIALSLIFRQDVLLYESENGEHFISIFRLTDYGILAVFFRVLVFWPLVLIKVVTFNFFNIPNFFSAAIGVSNFLFVMKFRYYLLNILKHPNFLLICLVVSGLFFFQMQRVAILLLVLFVIKKLDERKVLL